MLNIISSPLLMTWLDMFVKFGSGLMLLPVATLYLTPVELAFYLFIGTLLGLAYLAEGGLNKVILRSVAYFNNGLDYIPNSLDEHSGLEQNSSPNYKQLGRLLATSFYLYLALGFAGALALFFIGGLVADNIISKQKDAYEASIVLFLLSFFVLLYIIQLRYIALLQGINYLAKQKRIEIVFGLIRFLLLFIALILGFGVLGVTVGLIVSVIISFALYHIMWIKLGPIKNTAPYKIFDKEMLLQLYPAGWKQAILAWGSYFIYSGTTILVAQLEDVKLIASYLLTLQIIFILTTISSAPAYSSYPETSKAIAEKNYTAYKSSLFKALKISLSLYIAGALIIALLANPLLIFIGSSTEIITGYLLLTVLAMYFLELHHTIHATFYTTTNHIPFVYPALISGFIILTAGYFTIDELGIWGVVIIQFIVQLSFNNWYPVYLNYNLIKRSGL